MVSDKDLDNGCARLSVSWRTSEFVKHVTEALWSLQGTDTFTDVTLVCPGYSVRAHRVLLAACSPYLRTLFRENPCTHPVLIFKDIHCDDLSALIYFIYHGEVSVPQNQLTSLFAAAESLQIRGLTDETDSNPNAKTTSIDLSTTEQNPDVPSPSDNEINKSPKSKRRKISTSIATNSAETTNAQSGDQQFIKKLENTISINDDDSISDNSALNEIDLDNVNDPSTDLVLCLDDLSEETNQDNDDVKFRCQVCWKSFKHPISLSLHRDLHTGKTQCPICHRSFSRSYDMRCHVTRIHLDQSSDIKLKTTKPSIENNT